MVPRKGKAGLTSEMISRLPAAALITAHRRLGSVIRKGFKDGLIPSEVLTEVLEKLELDQQQETAVYDSIEELGIVVVFSKDAAEAGPSETDMLAEGYLEAEAVKQDQEILNQLDAPNAPLDSMALYLRDLYSIPKIQKEELQELFLRVEDGKAAKKDLQALMENEDNNADAAAVRTALEKRISRAERARNRLTEGNLRLVVSVARRYVVNSNTMLLQDLIEEGNLGLMKAVDRYDRSKGFQFSTYATWWIRQAISRALADKDRTIRIPSYMIDHINKVYKTAGELPQTLGRKATSQDLAVALAGGIEEWDSMGERGRKQIRERIAVAMHVSQEPVSLDAPVGDEDSDTSAIVDFVADMNRSRNPEEATNLILLRKCLDEVLDILPPRENKVIRLRFGMEDGHSYTLEEVGKEFRLTKEMIRQIQNKALAHLQVPAVAESLRDYLMN